MLTKEEHSVDKETELLFLMVFPCLGFHPYPEKSFFRDPQVVKMGYPRR